MKMKYTYFVAYDIFTDEGQGKANCILIRDSKIDSYEKLKGIEQDLQEKDNLPRLPIISNFIELDCSYEKED